MGIGAQELAKLACIRICAGCDCVTCPQLYQGLCNPTYIENIYIYRLKHMFGLLFLNFSM